MDDRDAEVRIILRLFSFSQCDSNEYVSIFPSYKNHRLREGLEIIDRIDPAKLRLLVSRVCQCLQSGVGGNAFSKDEEEKLSVSLELNETELSLLLDTVTLIYAQAAYHVVKPALMESYMKETFNIREEKVTVLVKTWGTYAKGIVEELRQKSIFPVQVKTVKIFISKSKFCYDFLNFISQKVNEINWNLNVQASSTAVAKDTRPTVILQLGLTDASIKDGRSSLTIESDKSGLLELYNNLEKIQSQLDSLK